jgi:hypothetical protein
MENGIGSYRGWTWYTSHSNGPKYYAYQWGVRVCNSTLDGLFRVIDLHIHDRDERRLRP